MKTLAGRTVEQNRILLSFPNCRSFHRPGPVHAKEDSAGPAATHKNAFRHAERAHLEQIVLTKNFVDIFSQVFQVLQSDHTGQHWNFCLRVKGADAKMNGGVVRIE
jgi:hypothetical protein